MASGSVTRLADTNYWTLTNTVKLSASYNTYTNYSGRKFSDYKVIIIVPQIGDWCMNGIVIPQNKFMNTTGVAMYFHDGQNLIEVDVKYVSDTSFDAKYIGTTAGNVYLNIYGLNQI